MKSTVPFGRSANGNQMKMAYIIILILAIGLLGIWILGGEYVNPVNRVQEEIRETAHLGQEAWARRILSGQRWNAAQTNIYAH